MCCAGSMTTCGDRPAKAAIRFGQQRQDPQQSDLGPGEALCGPDDLSTRRVAGAPAFGQLGDQEQAAAAFVLGDCLAVDQNTASGANSQRWTLTAAAGGYYNLVNVGSGLVAGVAQSSIANGASVIQWNDVGVDDQLWKIVRVD